MDYETLPLPGGPLEHVETYVYYDGRQTFAMRSTVIPELHYIFNTVAESEDTLTVLVAPMYGGRFAEIRNGDVPFRDTFENPGPIGVLAIVWEFGDGDATSVSISPLPGSVPEEWLPTPAARLNLGGPVSVS